MKNSGKNKLRIASDSFSEIHRGTMAVEAASRAVWRRWLEKHGDSAKPIWLIIYHRKSETPSISYDEAVEEALCFGWIDSKPNKRNEESYYLLMAPRKAKSNWSRANRIRAEKMIAAGKMTHSGLDQIEQAKADGRWEKLEQVQNAQIPEDLLEALKANPQAHEYFEQFPMSSKRIILEWIMNARKAETRTKRIKETVEKAALNIRANHYR